MEVKFGEIFATHLPNFPVKDQLKIREFVKHVKQYGLDNLIGRNKSSDNVPTNAEDYAEKVAFARKYQLWHYHIGIPNYETTKNGEQVSEYILHYMRFDNYIKIVAMSYHPPFQLPSEDELK